MGKKNGKNNGKSSYEEKTGIFSLTKEQNEENLRKGRQKIKELGLLSGKNNHNYDTMYITNGTLNNQIKNGTEIPEGWQKGRAMPKGEDSKSFGKISITDGTIQKFIYFLHSFPFF